MMRLHRPRNKKNIAQAMVEFALVAPLLFTLLFGIIEAGRLLFVYGTNVTAARQAARYGSATGLNSGGIPYYADCDGIRAAVKAMGFASGYTNADIHITYDAGLDASGNPQALNGISLTTECQDLTPSQLQAALANGDRIVIRVSTNWIAIVSGLVPIPSLTLTAKSERTIITGVDIEVTAPPGYYSGSGGGGGGGGGGVTPNTPTQINTPPNTSTPSSATAAFTATRTVSPTLTSTVTGTPPTNTPTSTPTCFVGTSSSLTITSSSISYTVTNLNTDDPITISALIISFDNTSPSGQSIIAVKVNGLIVWSGNESTSPADFANFQDTTSIDPLGSATVQFFFSDPYNTYGSSVNEAVATGFIEEGCSAVVSARSTNTPTLTPTMTYTPTNTPTSTKTPTPTNTPCAPGSNTLSFGSRSGNTQTLNWTASVSSPATSYEIYHSEDGITYSLIDTKSPGTTTTASEQLTGAGGTVNYFKILPKNGNGCGSGSYSNIISVTK